MKHKDISHEPLFLENPAGNSAVIFIHGLMRSPRQFDKLADVVFRQGHTAESLLLPGHGGKAKDFGKGTFERWQAHVDAEIERLTQIYDGIRLVGHSIGGLLALNAAAKHVGHVRGVLTIATPFKLTLLSPYSSKVRLRKLFLRKDDPIKNALIATNSVTKSPNILWRAIGPTVEVKKLMAAARESLHKIDVPVTAVYSSSDELTSLESLGILSSGLSGAPFEQVLLSDSLHSYFPEHEQAMIEQALLKLLSRG